MVKVNKKQAEKYGKIIGVVAIVVALVVTGVAGTLSYQSFINGVKAEGKAEYQLTCEKFKDGGTVWLECDE